MSKRINCPACGTDITVEMMEEAFFGAKESAFDVYETTILCPSCDADLWLSVDYSLDVRAMTDEDKAELERFRHPAGSVPSAREARKT